MRTREFSRRDGPIPGRNDWEPDAVEGWSGRSLNHRVDDDYTSELLLKDG